MKRGSPRTMKTCLPTRCRGGPAGPPRADAWVGPYLSFSEQTRNREESPEVHSSCVLRVFVTSWLHFWWVHFVGCGFVVP